MNILSIVRLKKLSIFQHYTVSEDILDKYGARISAGTNGIITSTKNKGEIHVLLETGFFAIINANDAIILKDRNDFSIDNALALLDMLNGHHCRTRGQVQFNIKYNGGNFPSPPDIVFEHLSEDLVYSYIEDLAQDVIMTFCDNKSKFVDTPIISYFYSVEDCYIAGRSGGYLVLDLRDNWESSYEYAKEVYQEELSDLDYELSAGEINKKEYKEELAMIQKYRDDVYQDIIESAYDVDMIGKLIKVYKKDLLDRIASIETWEHLIEAYA